MKLPTVRSETIESIIEEVCTKNTEFGVKDFRSTLDTENFELACVLYSFLDSVADDIYDNELAKEQVCALSKICCHLLYKSLQKQIEINEMEGSWKRKDFGETVAKRFEQHKQYRKEFLLELLNQIEQGNSIMAVNMIKYITEGVNKWINVGL